MHNRFYGHVYGHVRAILVCAFTVLCLGRLALPATAIGTSKITSAGLYADAAGVKHNWQITEAHALLWDSAPYLPVGGTFAPRSFLNPSEAAWQEDVQALTALKTKGLRDLIIWPAHSLPNVPQAALQRLLDWLDANDFRYGLSFGSGLGAPLTGTVVKPGAYRYTEPESSFTATWQVTECDKGLFLLADKSNENAIARLGTAFVRDNTVSVPVETPVAAGSLVALFYPHKSLPPDREGVLPDLWGGYDAYRDRVLATLGQIKFGKGLRFFLDPLAHHLGLTGETDYLVPESTGFALEWESFLARRYPNREEAKIAWGLSEGEFKTHRQLARLLPLWANGSGVPYLLDTATRTSYRILNAQQSHWWSDFIQCRNESVQYYMNAMANVLKRQIADVPVVYTWTQTHPIFWNLSHDGGYDGLGLVVRQRGDALVGSTLGPAYSEAEQAERTIWCVATEIVGEPTTRPSGKVTTVAHVAGGAPESTGGYVARADLFSDLDTLRRIGFKGFFASGFQNNPGAPETEWVRTPETLDWLQEYASRMEHEPDAARIAPHVLFFPQIAPGLHLDAHIGKVPGTNDVLWLNSFYSGEPLDWWPSYTGYTIQRGENGSQETVLMSLQGRRETHLWVSNAKQVQAFAPDGSPVPLRIVGKNQIIVTLDSTPTVFQAGGQRFIPQEAAAVVVVQLNALIHLATAQHVVGVDNARPPLDRAAFAYRQKDYETAYNFALPALNELTYFAAPYIWIEGEKADKQTFGEIAANAEASNGSFLRLSTANPPPPRTGYAARYRFDVPQAGRYNIWLAGTVPGPNTSPIQWYVNTEPEQSPADHGARGQTYLGNRFGWILLGAVNLPRSNQQSLTINVVQRAGFPSDYIFSIDAILLTPRAFEPNGPIRPLPVDANTLRSMKPDKKIGGL